VTIYALVSGTLHGAPVASTSRTGRPYTRAKLAVVNGNERRLVTLFAFSDTVQSALAHLREGDSLSVQGRLNAEIYQPNSDPAIVSLSLNVTSLTALGNSAHSSHRTGAI
jgi:hypothetical protein